MALKAMAWPCGVVATQIRRWVLLLPGVTKPMPVSVFSLRSESQPVDAAMCSVRANKLTELLAVRLDVEAVHLQCANSSLASLARAVSVPPGAAMVSLKLALEPEPKDS